MGKSVGFAGSSGTGTVASESATDALQYPAALLIAKAVSFKRVAWTGVQGIVSISGKRTLIFGFEGGSGGSDNYVKMFVSDTSAGGMYLGSAVDVSAIDDDTWLAAYWHHDFSRNGVDAVVGELYALDSTLIQGGFVGSIGSAQPTTAGSGAHVLHGNGGVGVYGLLALWEGGRDGADRYSASGLATAVKLTPFSEGTGSTAADDKGGNAMTLANHSWETDDPFDAAPTASVTGTATAAIEKNDIVTGGKTIALTLTDATWIAA